MRSRRSAEGSPRVPTRGRLRLLADEADGPSSSWVPMFTLPAIRPVPQISAELAPEAAPLLLLPQ